ncbi:hypothetical protein CP532_0640 [Ophiocordyceps camponoti-leonardi (nom. inval.)]|nr:hypothetical protein CP532_0640 [Ophiocordyceps camponoti-leonardi (nom. inval.)]
MLLSSVKDALAAAALTLSVFTQQAVAHAKSSNNNNNNNQNVMIPDDDAHAMTTTLRYGHCYIIKNSNGEQLGHQPVAWGYLRFGDGNKKTTFRVCQSVGQCRLPHTSPYRQILWNPSRFWLFDVEGNDYSPQGSIVAANAQPFSSGGLLYPSASTARYYVNFWAENDRCGADERYLGNCPLKLRVDNLRDDQGLTVGTDKFLRVTKSGDNYVNVTFHERECPEDRDMAKLDGEL